MYGQEPIHVDLRGQHLMSCSTAFYLILFLNYIYLIVPQHHNHVCAMDGTQVIKNCRTPYLPPPLFEVGTLTQLVTHQFGQAGWPTVSKSLDTGIRLCHHSWFYVNAGDPNKSKCV